MVRAFRTELWGVVSIVFAESASKARYSTYLSATNAGYFLSLLLPKVRRSPEYDQRKTLKGSIPREGICIQPERLLREGDHPNG